ncbi:hypothetical protein [Sandarakinorhabdus sp.]|uniref:hypothetical protein n=1 Tax=Sandarakinorhabdus sp. TaxID=1916663 RepID=UPI0033405110
MQIVSPHLFLQDQFPKQFWPLIPSTLRTAYDAAKLLAAEEPILQIETALDNHGRLISWAVDLGFKRLIESGRLPFDFRWRSFAKPTGRYLEIRLPHSVLSISQVSDSQNQPRNVEFRRNGRLNNEPYFDLPEFESEQQVRGLPHLLITHGHQTLEFAHLGVPHPIHSRGFRYQSPNLMQMPHELADDLPPAENTDTDFEALGLLKQDLEQWQKDNDD